MIESLVVACIVFAAYAATRPPAVATLGRLYDDVVYLSVGKVHRDGHGYRSAQLVATRFMSSSRRCYRDLRRSRGGRSGRWMPSPGAALWLNILVTAAARARSGGSRGERSMSDEYPAAFFVIVPIVADRTMFYFSGATSEPWMLLGWAAALHTRQALERVVATRTAEASGLPSRLAGAGLHGAGPDPGDGDRRRDSHDGGPQREHPSCRPPSRCLRRSSRSRLAACGTAAMMARGPVVTVAGSERLRAWIPTSGVREFASFAMRMGAMSVPLTGRTQPTSWRVDVGKTLLLATAVLLCGLVGGGCWSREDSPTLAAQSRRHARWCG
jgi:hypothetical protein